MRLFGIQQSLIILLTIYLSTFAFRSYGQVLPSSTDISYLYNPNATIYLRHKLVSSDEKRWIILELITPKSVADSLLFGLALTPNLDKPLDTFTKLDMASFRIFESGKNQLFAIDISNIKSNFAVFRIVQKSTPDSYTYIIELGNPAGLIISTTTLTLPDLKGYAIKGSTVKLSTLYGANADFGVSFFGKNTEPSLPPMADMKLLDPFEKPDTTFTAISGDSLATTKTGLYTIFNEKDEKRTTFFRIEDESYPKIATVDKLIEASIYFLTRDERKKLQNSSDPKKLYDSFWLNNTNSAERAGKMISAYFNRVKEANEKFTTYKEGWKTDMGMIYIIFGPPDKVFRTNDGVQWVYKKTYELPSITFTFYSNNKFITSEYYELERSTQFQTVWFRAIELWRKGRKSL